MKKIVFLSLFTLCLPLAMMAQSNDDDLYFIPSKDKDKEVKAPAKKAPAKREVTTIYTAPGSTVVVKDRKGNTRDVDEYNRRYDARNNDFVMEDDTLYIKEKAQPGLEGEWVNGEFNGSQDDYEYAERIIRFRNPRYAISISSPFYWDVMYGANSWDWNVYSDGLYAYAFPTFSNRLWWDWRFNSFGGGFGWGSPYYGYGWGGYPGYWGGGYWGGGYWGGHWGHHHHGGYYPGWGGGGHWANNTTYTNRRWNGSRDTSTERRYGTGIGSQNRRTAAGVTSRRTEAGVTSRRTEAGTSRVVGTRSPRVTSRTDDTSRRGSYTRPSSTRNSSGESVREGVRSSRTTGSNVSRYSSGSSNRTYSRGSSDAPSRMSTTESTRRSYDNSSSSSSRSYTPSSSSRSSSGSYSGGGSSSSRSSGGGGSSGGGSSRGSRR